MSALHLKFGWSNEGWSTPLSGPCHGTRARLVICQRKFGRGNGWILSAEGGAATMSVSLWINNTFISFMHSASNPKDFYFCHIMDRNQSYYRRLKFQFHFKLIKLICVLYAGLFIVLYSVMVCVLHCCVLIWKYIDDEKFVTYVMVGLQPMFCKTMKTHAWPCISATLLQDIMVFTQVHHKSPWFDRLSVLYSRKS